MNTGIRDLKDVPNPYSGAAVFYVEETGSTMRIAESLVRSPDPPSPGTVIAAGYQSAGRGRLSGRRWAAEKDSNLLFTLIVTREETYGAPSSVLAGAALALYFEKVHGLAASIKWPNDVLIEGRKISGIMVEAKNGYFNIGIGININQTEFPEMKRLEAVSLYMISGRSYKPLELLPGILRVFRETAESGSWRSEADKRLYLRNREVIFNTGLIDPNSGSGGPGKDKNLVRGILRGLGEHGQLLVETENGIEDLFSGELVINS